MRTYGWNESDDYHDPEYAGLKAEDRENGLRRKGMKQCGNCREWYNDTVAGNAIEDPRHVCDLEVIRCSECGDEMHIDAHNYGTDEMPVCIHCSHEDDLGDDR